MLLARVRNWRILYLETLIKIFHTHRSTKSLEKPQGKLIAICLASKLVLKQFNHDKYSLSIAARTALVHPFWSKNIEIWSKTDLARAILSVAQMLKLVLHWKSLAFDQFTSDKCFALQRLNWRNSSHYGSRMVQFGQKLAELGRSECWHEPWNRFIHWNLLHYVNLCQISVSL